MTDLFVQVIASMGWLVAIFELHLRMRTERENQRMRHRILDLLEVPA